MDGRHLPHPAIIEAYGKGGFRFAGMSHRGSLLCLPTGIWPVAANSVEGIDISVLAPAFAPGTAIDHLLVGTGNKLGPLPQALREAFRGHHVALEAMTTGAAIRTYNILLDERRRVGALLIAVP